MKIFRTLLKKLLRTEKIISAKHLLSSSQVKAENKKLMNSDRQKISAGAQQKFQASRSRNVAGKQPKHHKKAK